MREILFRIWNKKEKRMLEDIHICPQYGWLVMSDNDALAEICGRVPDEDLIWMQYTGLKDKNGVKIFEGDIIKTYANYGYGKRKKEVEVISQVIYYVDEEKTTSGLNTNHMSAFKTKQLNKQDYTSVDWSMFFQCEVIGNIYDKEV